MTAPATRIPRRRVLHGRPPLATDQEEGPGRMYRQRIRSSCWRKPGVSRGSLPLSWPSECGTFLGTRVFTSLGDDPAVQGRGGSKSVGWTRGFQVLNARTSAAARIEAGDRASRRRPSTSRARTTAFPTCAEAIERCPGQSARRPRKARPSGPRVRGGLRRRWRRRSTRVKSDLLPAGSARPRRPSGIATSTSYRMRSVSLSLS